MKANFRRISLFLAFLLGFWPTFIPSQPQSQVQAATSYELKTLVRTYGTAYDAKNRINPLGSYPAGKYYLYRSYDGMVNISKLSDSPGAWINPGDNQLGTGSYYIKRPVRVYGSAWDARKRRRSAFTISSGYYKNIGQYIGMVQLEGKGWINPQENLSIGDNLDIIKTVKNYGTSTDAKNRTNAILQFKPGRTRITGFSKGMIRVTKTATGKGRWINPGDNRINYTPSSTWKSKLNTDFVHATIKRISTNYPNRLFGTDNAAKTANYIKSRLANYNYYNLYRQVSQAANNKLGDGLYDVINIVAKPKNYSTSKRDVVFVAHYDSVGNTPGANDNASGVAMAIELSRYFANHGADFNPVFLFCGGEETGKPGTEDFYRRYPKTLKNRTELVINLDMIGMGNHYQGWNANLTNQFKFYPQLIRQIGEEMNLSFGLKTNARGIADYKVFEANGIPTVTFMNLLNKSGKLVPYYHTPQDSIDKISLTTLQNEAGLIMNLVNYINRKL